MRRSAVLMSAVLLCGLSVFAQRQPLHLAGKVISVADGDTITIIDKQRQMHVVRLAGIDAPEKNQDFAEKARRHLNDLVYGKSVSVEGTGYDDYGRLVGKVLLKGRDVNLEQVIAGFAWHYKATGAEQSDRDRQLYESAEFVARRSKFNIWSDLQPTPPWEFDNAASTRRQESGEKTASKQAPPAQTAEPKKDLPVKTAPVKQELSAANSVPAGVQIIGNKNSRIYHWPGCPGYTKVAEKNQVRFASAAEAESAGYRAAKNCTQ